MIPFIRYHKIYFVFSSVLVLGSIILLMVFGLRLGIDFTGGSIMEIEYAVERPSNQEIREQLADIELGTFYIQPTGDNGVILRLKDINETVHSEILQRLGEVDERRFESIGPVIGEELKEKTKLAVTLALISIVLYIAFSFRKISYPLKSWQYGVVSLVALFHDALIALGIFVILGKYSGVEITIPIITALLAVLGYSINDTVVVFDRIRENILKRTSVTFKEIVNNSLNQVITRSINTSFTTLLALSAIFFLGGATLKYFSLVLIIGIITGTYSSVFLAAPLLVYWLERKDKKRISTLEKY